MDIFFKVAALKYVPFGIFGISLQININLFFELGCKDSFIYL
jgi:hypothetical protein